MCVEQKGEERNNSLYIFFSCSRPLSQHQTITLHSEAGGSIDSIFSPPCVAVILKLLSGYIQTGGGKMIVATSNANALGVITDTASFPIFLFFPACPTFSLDLLDMDQLHHLLADATFTPNALVLRATQGLLLTLN